MEGNASWLRSSDKEMHNQQTHCPQIQSSSASCQTRFSKSSGSRKKKSQRLHQLGRKQPTTKAIHPSYSMIIYIIRTRLVWAASNSWRNKRTLSQMKQSSIDWWASRSKCRHTAASFKIRPRSWTRIEIDNLSTMESHLPQPRRLRMDVVLLPVKVCQSSARIKQHLTSTCLKSAWTGTSRILTSGSRPILRLRCALRITKGELDSWKTSRHAITRSLKLWTVSSRTKGTSKTEMRGSRLLWPLQQKDTGPRITL